MNYKIKIVNYFLTKNSKVGVNIKLVQIMTKKYYKVRYLPEINLKIKIHQIKALLNK